MTAVARTAVRATPSDQPEPTFAELAYAVVGLLLVGQAFVRYLPGESAAQLNGGSAAVALTAGWLLLAVPLLLRRPSDILPLLRRTDPALRALLVLAVVSVVWSPVPVLSLRRLLLLVGSTGFGLYLGTRFNARQLLQLVALALGVAAVVSAALAFGHRSSATVSDSRGTAISGVFHTKNVFGRAMALEALTCLVLLLDGARPFARRALLAGGLLAAALVVVSGSRFALAVLVTGVVALGVHQATRRRTALTGVVVLYCAVGLLAVLALIALRPEVFLHQLGRDSTLTGRTQLWHASLDAIGRRPLLGYGYGGFWNGWSAPSTEVWLRNPWGPPNAHNGILDVALNLGLVGTALWLSSLYLFARRGYRWLRVGGRPRHTWPLLLLLFVVVYNLTEATTLQNPFFWSLLVASEVVMGTRRRAADDRQAGMALR